MPDPVPFSPAVGDICTQAGGPTFKCVRLGRKKHTPILQNMKSGWTIVVHDAEVLPDGTVDWSHSTDGHFEALQ